MVRVTAAYICAGLALVRMWEPEVEGFSWVVAVWVGLALLLALWAQVVPNIGDHARRKRIKAFDAEQAARRNQE